MRFFLPLNSAEYRFQYAFPGGGIVTFAVFHCFGVIKNNFNAPAKFFSRFMFFLPDRFKRGGNIRAGLYTPNGHKFQKFSG